MISWRLGSKKRREEGARVLLSIRGPPPRDLISSCQDLHLQILTPGSLTGHTVRIKPFSTQTFGGYLSKPQQYQNKEKVIGMWKKETFYMI